MNNVKLSLVIAIAMFTFACAAPSGKPGEEKPFYETLMTGVGGIAGGILGNQVGNNTLRPLTTFAGGFVGAEMGRRLGKYMDEQDRQNLQQQMTVQFQEEKPQTSVACSNGTRGFGVVAAATVNNVSCGDKNKIILKTSSTFTAHDGQTCKEYKTEVVTPEGHTETVPAKACQGKDGQFHDVT